MDRRARYLGVLGAAGALSLRLLLLGRAALAAALLAQGAAGLERRGLADRPLPRAVVLLGVLLQGGGGGRRQQVLLFNSAGL